MKRVHIVGPPRSGTTLMLELMGNGFGFSAVSPHETSLLELPHGAPEDGMVLTKNPQDHDCIRAVIERDENQWFISMARDPRDIVSSQHGARPEVYWANLRQWRNWLDNTRGLDQHPRYIEIRYEQLVSEPDEVQQELAKHLPFLPVTRPFSQFHRFSQPSAESLQALGDVRPLDENSVGKWRQHLPRVAGQLKIHGPISRELAELGYEQDDAWLKMLEGIEPDTRSGHWPEFVPPKFAAKKRRQKEARVEAYLQARGL
jgi:hypothetical protein